MQISTEYAYQYKGGRQTEVSKEPWDFDGLMRNGLIRRMEMSEPLNNNGDEVTAERMRVHEEIQAKMQEIQKNPDYLHKLIAASGLKPFSGV